MVSLNTLFTLGVIGAGLLAFTSLGGAGGIGQRIGGSLGGGIRSFNENISTSFNQALQGLNPFAAAQDSAAATLSGITQPISEVVESVGSGGLSAGSLETSPSEYGSGSTAVDTSGAPKATPISTSFQPQVISGVVEPEFAAKYSFVAPKQGALDVSKAFQYINQPLSVVNDTSQVAKISNTRAASNYGGYGTASQQNTALASLIATNASKYGAYFS